MNVFLIVFLSLAAVILLAYLLVFIRPHKAKPSAALDTDYAHRGLHGDLPENSLAAFEAAVCAGYGIELDIQLSSDGEVMVFHDYTLSRMTGREGYLSDFTAAELGKLTLGETDQHIPRFTEVLELVNGRVPLLVELKGENFSTALCDKAAELLKGYGGPYCIESFNPMLVGRMAELLPDAYRGILYTNVIRDKKKFSVINAALTLMATNFLAKPNFISYNEKDRMSLPVRICTGLYGAKKFVWTVRDRESYEDAAKNNERAIFEGFLK